ncbi:MAG: HRDC domain-containing protein [Victivallales bacterium]|nr:HRDC domain-containing protein [Victivallales bacterium]
MAFPLITDNDAFAAFCKEALQRPSVGIDTEFVWTKTYYPKLGLLQMAYDREHCILVDTLVVTDTSPLAELLAAPGVVKVFHEAGSDLPILHRWCGAVPCKVADTRIAAGFCGLTAALSLRKLLISQLGVVLKKTETRTDWLRRPLSDAQIEYAGDDVIYLPELFLKLKNMMAALENFGFFQEEMQKYESVDYYAEVSLEDSWQHVSRPGYLKFTMQDYAVLQRLAAWRERLAREKDITRNRIIRDGSLALAAVKHPYSINEVARLEGMENTPAMKYAKEIAEVVTAAMKLKKDEWPVMDIPNVEQRLLRQTSERILSLARKRAEARRIDLPILASRREVDSLATAILSRGDLSSSSLMNGWKHEVLGKSLDDICKELRGKKQPR